jgi:hypothetical protein
MVEARDLFLASAVDLEMVASFLTPQEMRLWPIKTAKLSGGWLTISYRTDHICIVVTCNGCKRT